MDTGKDQINIEEKIEQTGIDICPEKSSCPFQIRERAERAGESVGEVKMKLKTGQSVKVKKGILCPDDPEFDLSGWQGRVIDIGEDENGETIIDIAWDSITLKEMSEEYIVKFEDDGLDWASMYLFPSDVEQVKERDSKKDTDKIRNELENRFGFIGMGEEGKTRCSSFLIP
jgi:hypothetical protein